jgi:hypothetical protein
MPPGRFLSVLAWGSWSAVGVELLLGFSAACSVDSLAYHLELPKCMPCWQGLFYALNLYGGFPQLVEMLFSWAMLLGSANTALVLNWAAGAAPDRG